MKIIMMVDCWEKNEKIIYTRDFILFEFEILYLNDVFVLKYIYIFRFLYLLSLQGRFNVCVHISITNSHVTIIFFPIKIYLTIISNIK